MSGLEKFQGTSDWMQRFKSLLSTNRDQKTPPRDLDSSSDASICIELDEGFHNLLEEKNTAKIKTTSFKMENKENLNPISVSNKNDSAFSDVQYSKLYIDDDSIMNPSFVEGTASSLEITNLSFSALEQACNKSISDPDSTIHNYVEQIRKNKDSKSSNIDDDSLEQNAAIDRLIRNLETEELKYSNQMKSPLRLYNSKLRQTFGIADQTQLADVEEPSALWETTITDNIVEKYQISPTKMVGLLRPSTILEESSTSNLTGSIVSENSFKTAQKMDSDQTNCPSDVTSQYDTASESVRGNLSNIKLDYIPNSSLIEKKDAYAYQKHKFYDNAAVSSTSSKDESSDETSTSSNESFKNDTSNSSKDDQQGEIIHLHNKNMKQEKSFEKIKNSFEEAPIIIEVSDDEVDEANYNKSHGRGDGDFNEAFSIQNIEEDNVEENSVLDETLSQSHSVKSKDLDVSRDFNDTLEEVEYIMKRGMQMLKTSATKPKIVENVEVRPAEIRVITKTLNGITPLKLLSQISKTKAISPILKTSPVKSHFSSGFYSNLSSKSTLLDKYKSNKSPSFAQKVFSPKYNVNTPPLKNSPSMLSKTKQASVKKGATFTEKDMFKKPTITNNSKIPQSKGLTNIKKSCYADVISPVGAYIKKTPFCPTEAKIKETTIKSLEYGQATGKATLQYHPPKRFEIKKGTGPSLPHKCYKSAKYGCVVDERTPLNIPGGDKIHKYLKPALMPSIVRHDGKMKMGSPIQFADIRKFDVNKTVDSTMTDLSDLSTISGDVSIYTLRDAQKFSVVRGNTPIHKK